MLNHAHSSYLKEGMAAAWPICLGYVPIGLAFGVLAHNAGLAPWEIGLMSLFVYAGSSQFIAVSMISSGSAVVPIIMTTFIVNLRHLLMSSSLAVYLQGLGVGRLSLYAYGVTDESFALNMARFRDGDWDWRKALALNHTSPPCSSACWSFRSGAAFMSWSPFFQDCWPLPSRCSSRATPIL